MFARYSLALLYSHTLVYLILLSSTNSNQHDSTKFLKSENKNKSKEYKTFGTGISHVLLKNEDQIVFQHKINSTASVGVMTHFWVTGDDDRIDTSLFKFYIDEESVASIEFQPALACSVGFEDTTAPWGNKLFGKGASTGAWYTNIRIPFQKSILITANLNNIKNPEEMYFYVIVRGTENLPIKVGEINLPTNARLVLQKNEKIVLKPLEFIDLFSLSSGNGLIFLHSLSVSSQNENFEEGCHHLYTNNNNEFPGTVISTGTEDLFISAYYFNAGSFIFENSGRTHFYKDDNKVELSAYRVFDTDVIAFNDGVKFVWRNGDLIDENEKKCFTYEGGKVAGDPKESTVTTYTWAYVWQ